MKTTAVLVLEGLRLMAQERAEESKAEALSTQLNEEDQASAAGAYGAYQAVANLIEKLQAEGFSDPDLLQELATAGEDVEQREASAQRSLRLRQNCRLLGDSYQNFWNFLVIQTGIPEEQLGAANPMFGLVACTSNVLQATVAEWTPEQHAHTETMLNDLNKFLEALKALIVASRSDGGIIH